MLRNALLAITLLGAALATVAERPDSIRYEAEVRSAFAAGRFAPFWMWNNLHGLGTPERLNGYVRAAAFKDADPSRRFTWEAGADIAAGWNLPATVFVRQLYAGVKYRSLGAWAGSRITDDGFDNPELGSGDLLFGRSYLPIPQVRVGIFDYTPVWGTDNWLGVKGYIAYGKFTDGDWQKHWAAPDTKYTEDMLFHSKGLWFRVGNRERFPLEGEIGIEMATQFGGRIHVDGHVYDMPHGPRSWIKALFPGRGGSDTPHGERFNIEGNYLGTYDISLSWHPQSDWSVRAYYQHFFEDQSQMTFEYGWKDGLYGIEANLPANPWVKSVTYEYMYSKDHTGAVYHDATPDNPEQVSGRDWYYNHYLYPGWQNWGTGIANPLFLSPLYNRNHMLWFYDTRIIAHHVGLSGEPTGEWKWKLLLTYTRNWGCYLYPYEDVLGNFSAYAEAEWHPVRFKGWYGKAGVGFDAGRLLGHNAGLMLSVGYSSFWKLPKKKVREL